MHTSAELDRFIFDANILLSCVVIGHVTHPQFICHRPNSRRQIWINCRAINPWKFRWWKPHRKFICQVSIILVACFFVCWFFGFCCRYLTEQRTASIPSWYFARDKQPPNFLCPTNIGTFRAASRATELEGGGVYSRETGTEWPRGNSKIFTQKIAPRG